VPKKDIVRVVVCDDSLVAREMLATILASDTAIEVVGQAKDGVEAVEMVARLKPDLVTMDIHMPRMDGLKATEQIMAFNPTPILVVSTSVYGEGMGLAFEALTFGALDVVKKPEPRDWADLQAIGRDLIRKVKLLANVRVITHIQGRRERAAEHLASIGDTRSRRIVAVGSSTGGPSALLTVLGALPARLPAAVVVAQHIADGFIPGLVTWLEESTANKVVAAEDGQLLEPSTVYFAPTGCNLSVRGDRLVFEEKPAEQLYIPSVDRLFESVATSYGRQAIGVLLTGMGADGARGLKRMHDAGGATIAQDEATSTVFGMPKAAIEVGAADQVLAMEDIGQAVVELLGEPAGNALRPSVS
jgi:two-component system chemotaxis response regulator CheB